MGFCETRQGFPADLNCHRKDTVIKYLESGDPEIAILLINANTSFVCQSGSWGEFLIMRDWHKQWHGASQEPGIAANKR